MNLVEPKVTFVAQTVTDYIGMSQYLYEVGGSSWLERTSTDQFGERLVEFGGRLCYRSWEPGLNPNVNRIREDSAVYLKNILDSGHGSVLEHATMSFVFHNVSRVFTHELVRHRVGSAFSQESLRFVRLDNLPFWFPKWSQEDDELYRRSVVLLEMMEMHQKWMADHFGLDNPGVPFSEKKAKTSFMRRFAPEGVATGILWTANVRTIRHCLEMRTALGAEEEMREVFNQVGDLAVAMAPMLFGDYAVEDNEWKTEFRKV